VTITMIACSRGGPRCECGRRADRICDFPLTGPKAGLPCGTVLCDKCAMLIDVSPKRVDYCGPHARLYHKRKVAAVVAAEPKRRRAR
jgi:hypothetical protein